MLPVEWLLSSRVGLAPIHSKPRESIWFCHFSGFDTKNKKAILSNLMEKWIWGEVKLCEIANSFVGEKTSKKHFEWFPRALMNTIMKENEGRHDRTELSKIQMKACSCLFVTALWGRRAFIFQKEGYWSCCFGESEAIWNDTEKACVKQVRHQTEKQPRPPSNDGFQSALFSSERLCVWNKILSVAIWQLSLLDLCREAKISVKWFLSNML